MSAVVDALFALTVLGMAIPVAKHLPPRPRAVLIAWLLVIGLLAGGGAFLRAGRVPPYFAAVGLLSTAVALAFVYSRAGSALLTRTPATWLIGLQAFRVVVEVVLWALAHQHRLSPLLTFEGRNFDILVGLTALPVAWLCLARRVWSPRIAVAWNVAGIVILVNIVLHALLSAPTPFQMLQTEPPTTIITTVPYIWLPGFLVPLAFALHAASLRTLGAGRAPSEPRPPLSGHPRSKGKQRSDTTEPRPSLSGHPRSKGKQRSDPTEPRPSLSGHPRSNRKQRSDTEETR